MGAPWSEVAEAAIVASAVAHGPASPDVDQTATWRRLTGWLPPEWRKHRGLSHWPELPLLALLLITQLPAEVRDTAFLLIVGWSSHIVGDAIFGKIPLLFGRFEKGLSLRTGGWVEKNLAGWAMGAALIYLLVAGWPAAATQDLPQLFPLLASTQGVTP